MWKICFEYTDGSKCTITGKQKEIPLGLAIKYHNQYGAGAKKATYQQYPKKDYEPIELFEMIDQRTTAAL